MTNHPNRTHQVKSPREFVVLIVRTFQGRDDDYSPIIDDEGNLRLFSHEEAEATRRSRQRFNLIHLPNRATGGFYVVRSLRWWHDNSAA